MDGVRYTGVPSPEELKNCPGVALRTSCENLAHNLQKRKSV